MGARREGGGTLPLLNSSAPSVLVPVPFVQYILIGLNIDLRITAQLTIYQIHHRDSLIFQRLKRVH